MGIYFNLTSVKEIAFNQENTIPEEIDKEISLNPFDVYSDMYSKLNNGETSELSLETFNQIMSSKIETDDALALNVIQAANLDKDINNISQDELNELYNVYFDEPQTTLDSVRNFIENPYELLAQYYLGKDLKDCTDEEINQIYTLNLIKQTLASSQENLKNQDNLDGFISETWDFGKELTGWGTCQKDVEKALAEQEEIVKELEQALIDGNFNEKYLELTGVEFDIDKITEYQEKLSEIQFVQMGLEKVNAFCDSLSNEYVNFNPIEAYKKFIEFYGEEKGNEKFLETIKAATNDPHANQYYYNPLNPCEKVELDDQFNLIFTYQDGTIEYKDIMRIEPAFVTYMSSDYNKEREFNNYLNDIEKATGINYQETLDKYETLTKEAFGDANRVTEILTDYIKSQESFIDICAAGAQWTGMGFMLIGGVATLFGCPFGESIMNAGNWLAIGGMFGDNLAEGIDLATNNNFIKGDEEYYKGLLKETLTDTALFYSGYKINTLSSECLHLIDEIGVDVTLSLLADFVITGEVDIFGESGSQILGVVTGLARSKLDSMKVNTDADTKTNFIDPTTTGQDTLMPNNGDVKSGTIKPQETDIAPVDETKIELDHPVAGGNVGVDSRQAINPTQTDMNNEITFAELAKMTNPDGSARFNDLEIGTLAEIYTGNKTAIAELAKMANADGSARFNGWDIIFIIRSYAGNTNAVVELAKMTNPDGSARFNGLEIGALAKIYTGNETAIAELAKMTNPDGSARFNDWEIEALAEIYTGNETAFAELAKITNPDGSARFNGYNIKSLIESSAGNTNAVVELAKMTNPDGSARFNGYDIENLAKIYTGNETAIAELAKITNPDGSARFNGSHIKSLIESSAGNTNAVVELAKMTNPDGSARFNIYDIAKIAKSFFGSTVNAYGLSPAGLNVRNFSITLYDTLNYIIYGKPVDTKLVDSLNTIGDKYGINIRAQNNIGMYGNKDATYMLSENYLSAIDEALAHMIEEGKELPQEIYIADISKAPASGVYSSTGKNAITINVYENDPKWIKGVIYHESAHMYDYLKGHGSFLSDELAAAGPLGITTKPYKNYKGVTTQQIDSITFGSYRLSRKDISSILREYAATDLQEFVAVVEESLMCGLITKNDLGYTINKANAPSRGYAKGWFGTQQKHDILNNIMQIYNYLTSN